LVAPIAVSLANACTPTVVPSCYGVTTTFNIDTSGYALHDHQQV
jgi:hypothetical protein